jgi:putative IMPACT (imprinted ancient) family translation regulator
VTNDLTQILVVVIRYFGGIKLGVSGLINAYKSATKDAFDHASFIHKTVQENYSVIFDYLNMNPVMRILKEENAAIIRQESGESCQILFSIRKKAGKKISERLQKVTNVSLILQGLS